MHNTFKILDKKDRMRGREEGRGQKKRREENPVVSEEHSVLLRVREHVPKKLSRYRIGTTNEGHGFLQDRSEEGRMDTGNVEIRSVKGEPEGVLVSCPLFSLETRI